MLASEWTVSGISRLERCHRFFAYVCSYFLKTLIIPLDSFNLHFLGVPFLVSDDLQAGSPCPSTTLFHGKQGNMLFH